MHVQKWDWQGGAGASDRLLVANGVGITSQLTASGNYYVTTDSNGNFSIGNDYTCTSGQQVYLYAVGGNAGAGNNSAAGMLAILGA